MGDCHDLYVSHEKYLGWDSNLRSIDNSRLLSFLDLSLSPLRYRSDAKKLCIKECILHVGTNNRLFVPT